MMERWAARTGYDSRGIGWEGRRSVNDYIQEEVAALPRLYREELLGYCDEVAARVTMYPREARADDLLQPGAGLESSHSKYQLIPMASTDNARHLGEVLALKARWQRRAGSAPARVKQAARLRPNQ